MYQVGDRIEFKHPMSSSILRGDVKMVINSDEENAYRVYCDLQQCDILIQESTIVGYSSY
jgi:hypothetical protein